MPIPSDIPTTGTTSNGCPITVDQAAGEVHLLNLLNADRVAAGVGPLTLLYPISVASREHSCDMGRHSNLSHFGSDGSNPLQRISATSTSYSVAGENIGTTGGRTIINGIDTLNSQMMQEPPTLDSHHVTIINSAYHHVGIGVIYLWITEDFVN